MLQQVRHVVAQLQRADRTHRFVQVCTEKCDSLRTDVPLASSIAAARTVSEVHPQVCESLPRSGESNIGNSWLVPCVHAWTSVWWSYMHDHHIWAQIMRSHPRNLGNTFGALDCFGKLWNVRTCDEAVWTDFFCRLWNVRTCVCAAWTYVIFWWTQAGILSVKLCIACVHVTCDILYIR